MNIIGSSWTLSAVQALMGSTPFHGAYMVKHEIFCKCLAQAYAVNVSIKYFPQNMLFTQTFAVNVMAPNIWPK